MRVVQEIFSGNALVLNFLELLLRWWVGVVTSSLALVFKMSSFHVLYLLFSKISEIFRLVDKCSDRWSLCQIFMVSVYYIRSSLFPPDFHKVKDLFWSLLSYRCGDMVVSRFFYKFALILPMYFSNWHWLGMSRMPSNFGIGASALDHGWTVWTVVVESRKSSFLVLK